MKVVALLENSAVREGLKHLHGLSLYIETPRHKLICDMGPNSAFLENAQTLGVDIKAVDMAFLSHGHHDHGGGLEAFCIHNDRAKVCMASEVFGSFYAVDAPGKLRYIGIDPDLRKYSDRFLFCHGHQVLDEELQVFSDISTRDYSTSANSTLCEKTGNTIIPQDFRDEQNLLITAEGKSILVAGCAHRGIVNIMRRAEEILGRAPDYVFSGFHLFNPGRRKDEPEELIRAVGEELKRRPTIYFTGHCTGEGPFSILRELLGERIQSMPGGSVFEL